MNENNQCSPFLISDVSTATSNAVVDLVGIELGAKADAPAKRAAIRVERNIIVALLVQYIVS